MSVTVKLVEKIELSSKELRVLRQLTIRNGREYLIGTGKDLIHDLIAKNLINETRTFHGSDFDKWANCKALRKSDIVTHRLMRKVYLNKKGDRVVASLKRRGLL